MKDKVETAIIEVTEDGRHKRYAFPIVTASGKLMTHRLRRLLNGKFGSFSSNGHTVTQHFVGMVWKPPYTVLELLIQERRALQDELLRIEGHNEDTDAPPTIIPKRATNDEITRLVSYELKLHKEFSARINRHNSQCARPYTCTL